MESVASRKPHRKRSDVARSPEFVKELQKKVRKDPGKGIRSLAREMNVGVTTMNAHGTRTSATTPTRGARDSFSLTKLGRTA